MDDSRSSSSSLNESGRTTAATTRQRMRPSPSEQQREDVRPPSTLRASRYSRTTSSAKRPFSSSVEFAANVDDEDSNCSLSASSDSVIDLTFLCFWREDDDDEDDGCNGHDASHRRMRKRKRHRLTVPVVSLILVLCLLSTMQLSFPENGAGRWIVANLEAAAKRKRLTRSGVTKHNRKRRIIRKEPIVYSTAPSSTCRQNAIVYFLEHAHQEYPHLLKSLDLLHRHFLMQGQQQQPDSSSAQILIFHLGKLTQAQMHRAESHLDNPVAGLIQWIDISHTRYYSKGTNTFWAKNLWDYLRGLSRKHYQRSDYDTHTSSLVVPYYFCTYKYVLLMQPGTFLHTPLRDDSSSSSHQAKNNNNNNGQAWGQIWESAQDIQLGYRLCLVQQQDVHQYHHLYTQEVEWIEQLWSAYPYTQTLSTSSKKKAQDSASTLCSYPDLRHFTILHVPTIQGSRSIAKLWKWMWERDFVEDLPLNVVLNALWGSILHSGNTKRKVLQFQDFGLQGMVYTYHPNRCIKTLEGMVQAGKSQQHGEENEDWISWTEEEVILPAHQDMVCSSSSSSSGGGGSNSFLVVDQVMQHVLVSGSSKREGDSQQGQRRVSDADYLVPLPTLYLSTKSHTEQQHADDVTIVDFKQWSVWSRKMLKEGQEQAKPLGASVGMTNSAAGVGGDIVVVEAASEENLPSTVTDHYQTNHDGGGDLGFVQQQQVYA